MDKPTVQDIFLRFYPGYLEKYSPSPVQSKVAHCIINCKTGAYGANISICEDCGHTQMINADVHRLFPSIDITMKTRLNSRADLSKERPPTLKGAMDEYFYQKYGESKQVRYINGMIVVPVAYCRTQNPMFFQVDTNRYTPQGRERIHRMLAKSEYGETLLKLSRDNDTNHSIEFCDNRLSRFVASKGKCELSKVSLAFEDVECIYLNPPSQGGTDEYANLRIVHKDIKSLIYSNDVKIIKSLIDLFDCRAPAKIAKLNKWRAKAGLEAINLITINQTLK
ncbi:Uncharacterised protein [uncultured Clostridium sp.]|uniref:Transposase zinc-binding domain-containing protein n=1 Tax=Muricoprocola aceti TaxID=2981772 RepID=A0ABT2SN67_9FIRM|nr:transposase zinc-binding domain-containing protein [Muricoprocola aceti]MCU6725950.1 transposase zinc-binding domain-containing protein [Muricoprocola aceti]SCH71830.1 Uncharacterised protein [uncultured Clostridium sp.]